MGNIKYNLEELTDFSSYIIYEESNVLNSEQQQQNDGNTSIPVAAPETDNNQTIPQELSQFFSIETKYFYIDKIENLNTKIDTLISSNYLYKYIKSKNPNISGKAIDRIIEELVVLNQIINDFLKIANFMSLQSIVTFYYMILEKINEILKI